MDIRYGKAIDKLGQSRPGKDSILKYIRFVKAINNFYILE